MAGVSRSGYYGWLKAERIRQEREKRDQADFQRILDAYRFRGYDKGVRGIHMRLLHTGVRMNPKKIRRLMRKYKLPRSQGESLSQTAKSHPNKQYGGKPRKPRV